MATQRPTFTNLDGSMTEDGRKLVEWIESQFAEGHAENNMVTINALSGDIKHYYSNVYLMNKMTHGQGGMTAEKWLSDYKNSIALNSWRNYQFMVEAEVKKTQLEATTEKTAALEVGLNELREALGNKVIELQAQNAALHAEIDALKAGKGKKGKAEPVEPEEEAGSPLRGSGQSPDPSEEA